MKKSEAFSVYHWFIGVEKSDNWAFTNLLADPKLVRQITPSDWRQTRLMKLVRRVMKKTLALQRKRRRISKKTQFSILVTVNLSVE